MADMQTTLSLVLQAKDEASAVFKQVGAQMAALGQQAERVMAESEAIGFKVDRPDAIKAALGQQIDTVRQAYDQQIALEKQKSASIAATAEDERQKIVKATQMEMLEAALAREQDLKAAETWVQDRKSLFARAAEAQKAALSAPGTPSLSDAQLQEMERANARFNEVIARQNKEGLARMLRDADETYRQRVNRAEAANEQELEGVRQREAKARGILQVSLHDLEQDKQREIAIWKAAAEAEQRTVAESAAATARDRVPELQRTMGQSLLAMPVPKITSPGAPQLSPFDSAFKEAMPPGQFEANLAAIATGAGKVTEKLAAIRSATENATVALATFYRRDLEEVRECADHERSLIADGLRGQLADIRTYTNTQITLIETTSKKIQQLLRDAYSAPGITEAMRTNIQQMIRDNEEGRQALVAAARHGGDELTAEADRTARASRWALDQSLKEELSTLRGTLTQEVALRKQASAEMAALARSAAGGPEEFEKSLGHIKEASETVLGPLSHVVEMGQQMLVWGIGYQMVMSVYSALTQAAGGLITVNARVEQLGMTFAALYQTNKQGGQAIVSWLNQFAALVPGTREEVQQAALSFASAGDSIRDILPAASNLSAIMGVDLPRAAQAMVDAQMGRFEMMQMTLHTTKAELMAYGLEVSKTGHVTADTFVPAVERYTAMRFGEHVRMDTQAVQALHQALGNAGSTFQNVAQGAAMVSAGTLVGQEGTVDPNDPTRASQAQAQRQVAVVNAFSAAMRGSLGQLSGLFGVTATALDKIDANWKKTEGSARAALEQWFKANYGLDLSKVTEQTSAIYKQMGTLSGAFSNVQDSLTNLQQILGQGMFNVLEQQVRSVYNALQSPALSYFATMLGQTLGSALSAVITRFKEWYASIGGLPGLLRLLQTVGQDLWGVLQGLGDALGTVGSVLSVIVSPITALLDLFGVLGERSKDGAGSLRFMTAAVVDLFAAFKAYQILDAVWGSLVKVVEAAQVATRAQQAQAVAAGQAMEAQGGLMVTQTSAAAAAAAEAFAEEGLVGGLKAEAEASTAAAVAAGEATVAQGSLAVAQTAATVSAQEEVTTLDELIVALEAQVPASALANAAAAERALPAEAAAGEAVAGATVGAETLGWGATAVGGITALGGAAVAAATPLLGMVAAILPAIVALDAFKDSLQLAKDEQHKAVAKPFIPPQVVSAIPTARQAVTEGHVQAVLSYYRGGFGAASGTPPPAGAESTTDPYSQFMHVLPKQGQTLFAHFTTGTGQQLLENETAFLAYLQSYPEALNKLNKVLKAAHKSQVTGGQIETALEQLRTAQLGYSQKDVDEATAQVAKTSARINADIKYYQSDIVGQINTLREATSQLVFTKTGDMNKAVAVGGKTVNELVENNWSKFTETTKEQLAVQPNLFDNNWIKKNWKNFSDQLKRSFEQQQLGPGSPGGQQGNAQEEFNNNLKDAQTGLQAVLDQGGNWPDIAKAYATLQAVNTKGKDQALQGATDAWANTQKGLQSISQHFQQLFAWDESLGMPATVLHHDIADWTAHLRKIGDKGHELAERVVPTIMQVYEQDIPSMVRAAPEAVDKWSAQLKGALAISGMDAQHQAAAYAKVFDDYATARTQYLQQQLPTMESLGTVDTGTEQQALNEIYKNWLKQNAEDLKKHLTPRHSAYDLQALLGQGQEAIYGPGLQAAHQAQQDRYTRALQQTATLTMGQIPGMVDSIINAERQRAALLPPQQRPTELQYGLERANLLKQGYDAIIQRDQEQLSHDQAMHRAHSVILADIGRLQQDYATAGHSADEIAIMVGQARDQWAQQEEGRQQSYVQYAEMMGESWEVILGHVNQRAAAMSQRSGVEPWQVVMQHGQDIEQAADSLLKGALANGDSFSSMKHIIDQGALALRDAGVSEIAIRHWMNDELRQAAQALQQQQQNLTAAFNLRMERGEVQSPQDVMRYVNMHMALYRQQQGPAGEKPEDRQVREQTELITAVKQGFDPLIGWAQKQFDWDTTGGNAAQALKDENRILALSTKEWTAEGIAPGDRKLMAEMLKYQLDQTRTGGYTRPAEPAYHAYGGLGRSPGFGGIEIQFGGPSTNPFTQMISILQSQLHEAQQQSSYWKGIAMQEAAQLRASQQTAQNTGRIAANTTPGHGQGHESIYPASNPVATTRRHGASVPVTNP